jgi:hypothetical protein
MKVTVTGSDSGADAEEQAASRASRTARMATCWMHFMATPPGGWKVGYGQG